MKRSILILTVVTALVAAACKSDTPAVSQEEAEQAFLVSYSALVVGSMTAAFDRPLPGIEIDREERTLTYREFDVSDMGTAYESLSGTVQADDNVSSIEFELDGGLARNISFEVAADAMFQGDRIQNDIEVNGRSFEIDIDRSVIE
ncbi:MAG: hypothetical protein ACLFP4_00805 [Spirochaetales bacterium]